MPESGIILIGGGGHALVVAEAMLLAGMTIAGFVDDDREAVLGRQRIGGERVTHVGTLAEAAGAVRALAWVLGLGDLSLRRQVLVGILEASVDVAGRSPSVVHPQAIVSPSAHVGPGAFVGPGAVVHTLATIATHVIINSGAIVEHECVIESNAHIAPGAVLGGRVRVGEGALVGIGSRVLPNVAIGSGATIGAGAVVTRDVEARGVVVGVPARLR